MEKGFGGVDVATFVEPLYISVLDYCVYFINLSIDLLNSFSISFDY